jgi:pyruvate carboxylase subunit B
MHPEQYRDYKSGKAKKAFEADLEKKKAEKTAVSKGSSTASSVTPINTSPSKMVVEVNGEKFDVTISYGENEQQKESGSKNVTPNASSEKPDTNGTVVVSPLEGKFYLTKDSSEKAIKVGDTVKEGDILGYVEAMKTYNAIRFDKGGVVKQILKENGSDVEEDDELVILG